MKLFSISIFLLIDLILTFKHPTAHLLENIALLQERSVLSQPEYSFNPLFCNLYYYVIFILLVQ